MSNKSSLNTSDKDKTKIKDTGTKLEASGPSTDAVVVLTDAGFKLIEAEAIVKAIKLLA